MEYKVITHKSLTDKAIYEVILIWYKATPSPSVPVWQLNSHRNSSHYILSRLTESSSKSANQQKPATNFSSGLSRQPLPSSLAVKPLYSPSTQYTVGEDFGLQLISYQGDKRVDWFWYKNNLLEIHQASKHSVWHFTAKPISQALQTVADGYGDAIARHYTITVANSKRSAYDMFMLIRSNFSSFVEGQSYFRKVSGDLTKPLEKGDEIAIEGGPGYSKRKPHYFYGKSTLDDVDSDGYVHSSPLSIASAFGLANPGVTVTNIQERIINRSKYYTMTFGTWAGFAGSINGHVEAGSISFTVSQDIPGKITLTISSYSKSSNFFTDFVYRNGGRKAQTEHWETFLNNFLRFSGGVKVDRRVR